MQMSVSEQGWREQVAECSQGLSMLAWQAAGLTLPLQMKSHHDVEQGCGMLRFCFKVKGTETERLGGTETPQMRRWRHSYPHPGALIQHYCTDPHHVLLHHPGMLPWADALTAIHLSLPCPTPPQPLGRQLQRQKDSRLVSQYSAWPAQKHPSGLSPASTLT